MRTLQHLLAHEQQQAQRRLAAINASIELFVRQQEQQSDAAVRAITTPSAPRLDVKA